MGSTDFQKQFAIKTAHLPTIQSLYDDPDVAAAQPLVPRWKDIFVNAVPRPSAPTKVAYNEVSSKFWTAVHDSLGGTGTASENLEILSLDLEEMKGGGW
jgi:trehalose/maltose transport system substrate-binding protein